MQMKPQQVSPIAIPETQTQRQVCYPGKTCGKLFRFFFIVFQRQLESDTNEYVEQATQYLYSEPRGAMVGL